MGKALSYLRVAFLAPANLLGLAAAGVGAEWAHNPLPALVALGVEGVYLGLLAVVPGYRRAIRARAMHEDRRDRESIDTLVNELSPSQREHYFVLRELRDKIEQNYRKLPGGGVLAASSQQSVDALLTAFLRLVINLNHYRKYLNVADRAQIQQEADALAREIAAETHPRLREVKEKRLEILRKRLNRFEQAAESRELISHQLAGIEDLLRLTHEQSIAIRDPESVNRQLETLSAEVASSEETVRQMERILEFDEELNPSLPQGERVR